MYRSRLTGREYKSKLGATLGEFWQRVPERMWKTGGYEGKAAAFGAILFSPCFLPVAYVFIDDHVDELPDAGYLQNRKP